MAFDGTIQELTVNMQGGLLQNPKIEAQQNDTASRKVKIHLKTFGNVDYIIPYGATAVLCVSKTDGTVVYDDCEIVDGSTVVITLSSQTVAAAGANKAQVYICANDGDIKSQAFIVNVPSAVYRDDAIKSSNEFGILQNLIEEVKDAGTIGVIGKLTELINIADEGESESTLKTEKLSGFDVTFTAEEVCYGTHKSGIADFLDKRSICTRGFIKPFVASITINSEGFRIAVVVYDKGTYVRTDSWYTNGQSYVFNHDKYQYKLYIQNTDNSYIKDYDGARKSITLKVLTPDILYAYNALEAKQNVELERMSKMLDSVMRRDYDISHANAPEPSNLITYVGNNQIVHPKVLYFPNKFARHRFWMAYNPYPWADGNYENPCVAYSDDGYEWTNIPANPLDDLSNHGGIGVNTDVHLVYVETKKQLEVWWRYVDKGSSAEIKTETLFRRTSTDGLKWTDTEVVLVNSTGVTVQYLSPCIIHDGSKYKMWVVNDAEGTIKYYEGMEDEESQTIALNDGDMHSGKALANGTIEETDGYMYTEKIVLGASKTFSVTGINKNGVNYHIPIRHLVAYDAEGKRLSEHSTNSEIAGGTVSSMSRPIVMDEAVDSVVITIYKPSNYTNKVITLEKSDETNKLSFVRNIPLTFPGDIGYKVWHIDVIEDNGKTVILPMCKGNKHLTQFSQTWSLFLATSDDNVTFTDPKLVLEGNPYGWDKQIYRSSIVNVRGEYRIYYTAQNEVQKHGLGICTSNTLTNFVGKR